MNSRIKDENTDFLFDCILKLETIEECYAFFEDLCTVPEMKAMAQRAAVAKLLSEKQYITASLKKRVLPQQQSAV